MSNLTNSLPLTPGIAQVPKSSGEPYLRLQLDSQTQAVLPMGQAQEVLVLPAERITPIPNMPDCVLGLLNQRSRVFWGIDLPQLLGLSPLEPHAHQYNLAIINVEDVPLALAVGEVKGVMRIAPDGIRSPVGTVASSLAPYLRGYVLKEEEILLAVDAHSLIHSPILQDLRF